MTDMPRAPRPYRYSRIDIDDRRNVMYWAGLWGLADKELLSAVAAAGPVAADVAAHLKQDLGGRPLY